MFKLTRNCEDMNKNCKKFYFISISLEKLGSLTVSHVARTWSNGGFYSLMAGCKLEQSL